MSDYEFQCGSCAFFNGLECRRYPPQVAVGPDGIPPGIDETRAHGYVSGKLLLALKEFKRDPRNAEHVRALGLK